MIAKIGNIINGSAMLCQSGRTASVFNPATGEQTGEVALSTTAEVAEAVAAAKSAQPEWVDTPPLKRARHMQNFRVLLDASRDELARLIGAEYGKVYSDASGRGYARYRE